MRCLSAFITENKDYKIVPNELHVGRCNLLYILLFELNGVQYPHHTVTLACLEVFERLGLLQ